MNRTRAAASLLAALAALLPAIGPAAAQNAGPVPYTQLVKRERPPRKPRPKPRPAATAPAAPLASAAGATATTAPPLPQALQPPAVAPAPTPESPPALVPRDTALPGTAPSVTTPVVRATPAIVRAPPPPPELPSTAAAAPAATPTGARLVVGAALPTAELESFVDGAVRQAGAAKPLAGVAVAVVQNGAVVLEKGYGFARSAPGTPVDPRATLFRLGSVSKVFTWIEVLKAVEAGRLHLDEPVNARLPPALRLPDDGFAAPVRLRNLMTHDAGFESREFGRLFLADAEAARPLAETLVKDRPHRVRAPGEMPTYSSYGAALAGFLAADAAHTPFEMLVETDLLHPAGLASTTFLEPGSGSAGAMPAALADRTARGFVWTRRGLEPQPYGYASGLGPALAASSTADDMARFMLAWLADGRAPGTGAVLWGPRTNAALRTPLSPGWAHGLMIYTLPGGFRGFGHDGATPGFRTRLVMVPQLGLGVFVAANSDTGDRLTAALAELIVRRFYAGPGPLAPPMPLPDAASYAGTYVSTRRAYHGLEGFVGQLTRLYRVSVEPDGALAVWGPEGGRRWFTTGAPGRFVAADDTGEPLTFLFDARARPRAFLDPAGQWGAERVDGLHRPELLAGVAAVAELAALLTLAGLFVRDPREYRQSERQATASRLQTVTAVLWLAALAAFTVFALTGTQAGRLQREWPNAWLVAASSAGLGAALLTLTQVALLPGAWASVRRVQGWSGGRKLRHTATVLAFAAFAFVLLGWGALEPWSS